MKMVISIFILILLVSSIAFAFSWTEPVQLFPDFNPRAVTLLPFSDGSAVLVGSMIVWRSDTSVYRGFYYREWTELGLGPIDSVFFLIRDFEGAISYEVFAFLLEDNTLWFIAPGGFFGATGLAAYFDRHSCSWIETNPVTSPWSDLFVSGPDTTIWFFGTDAYHTLSFYKWNGTTWDPPAFLDFDIVDVVAITRNDTLFLWKTKVLAYSYPDSFDYGLLKSKHVDGEWVDIDTMCIHLRTESGYDPHFFQGNVDSVVYIVKKYDNLLRPGFRLIFSVVSGDNNYVSIFDSLSRSPSFTIDSSGNVFCVWISYGSLYSATIPFIRIAQGNSDGWEIFSDSIVCPISDTITWGPRAFCNSLYNGPAYVLWATGLPDYSSFWGVRREPNKIDEVKSKPECIFLSIHPNPFNSAVTISAPTDAEIEIFDLSGREVITFKATDNFYIMENNRRIFIWQPDNTITSGVYLIKASSNSKISHNLEKTERKMTTKCVIYLK